MPKGVWSWPTPSALAVGVLPDVLIDVATLTGAQMIALGTHVAAVMSNDDSLAERIGVLDDRWVRTSGDATARLAASEPEVAGSRT